MGSPMGPMALDKLPAEVFNGVLQFILRPSDLKSLCLVSHRCFNLTVPQLYKDIRLPYYQNDSHWSRLSSLSSSRQLCYVRSIDIGDNHIQGNQICRALHDLLKHLPKGKLVGFYYHSTATPDARDIRYLWSSQPNLQRINFSFRMCSPSLIDVVNQDWLWLRRLRCIKDISVDLGDTTDSTLVERFLLMIDAKNVRTATVSWPLDAPASDTASYKHIIEPLLKWLPHDLEVLSLRWIPFEDTIQSDDFYFPALKEVELRACYKASAFLNAVVKSPIQRLTVRLHGDMIGDHSDEGWANLQHSVVQMKDLKTLMVPNHLSTRQIKLLSGSLLQALPKLRTLMLNYSSSEDASEEGMPWCLHPSNITGNLVEVALRLNDFPSGNFTRQCKSLIERLPRLEVLNLFHDLDTRDGQQVRVTMPEYRSITRKLADAIIATLDDSHPLRVLAFGMKWSFGSSLESLSFSQPSRACYLRIKRRDKESGQRVFEYLPEEDIRYVYPGSEVLAYAFSPHTDDAW